MVNFGPLAAEIDRVVWGTRANFSGFRVLATLLHGTWVLGVSTLCSVELRAPPITCRAAITLGIGPHFLFWVWCGITFYLSYFYDTVTVLYQKMLGPVDRFLVTRNWAQNSNYDVHLFDSKSNHARILNADYSEWVLVGISALFPSVLWCCWLGERKGLCHAENVCYISPKILFHNEWKAKTEEQWLTQVDLKWPLMWRWEFSDKMSVVLNIIKLDMLQIMLKFSCSCYHLKIYRSCKKHCLMSAVEREVVKWVKTIQVGVWDVIERIPV